MLLLPFVSLIAPHWKAPLLPRLRTQVTQAQALASAHADTGFEMSAVETARRQAGMLGLP
jgi:hypothetical protein